MKRGVFFSGASFLFIFGVVFLLYSPAVSAQSDVWSAGHTAEEVSDSRDFKYGHVCASVDAKDVFKKTSSTTGKDSYSYQYRTTTCGFYTDYGFTDGDRYLLRGSHLYLHDIDGGNTAFTRHYPNNIFIRLTAKTGWTELKYYDGNVFEQIPDRYVSVGTQGSLLKKYLSDINTISDKGYTISYTDGQKVLTASYNVSENGRYIAFADYLKGVFVHDTYMKTYKTVSTNLARGVGNIAVSNDGNTVFQYDSSLIREGARSGERAFVVYDTSGCEQTLQESDFVSTATFTDAGCVEIDISSDVYDVLGAPNVTTYYGMEHPYIHPRGGYVQGIFSVKRASDTTTQKIALRFTPENAPKTQGYLAMGDSFSSGEGDLQGGKWYELGTDEQGDKDTFSGRNLCHVSRRSYPYLLAKQLGFLSGSEDFPVTPVRDGDFHSVACSGAVMHNVVGGSLYGEDQSSGGPEDFVYRDNQYIYDDINNLVEWQQGVAPQKHSLNQKTFASDKKRIFNPEVVTLGIGGNDAGFGEKIEACALPRTCPYAVEGSEERTSVVVEIANLKYRLTDTYKQILRELPDGSRLYVHGYPEFIDASGTHPCGNNVPFNQAEITFISEGIRYMNQVVESAAREAGAFYVDVSGALKGFELCSGVEQENITMNGATAGNDINSFFFGNICQMRSGCLGNESFHPNPVGHTLYASTIRTQTNDLTSSMPEPEETLFPVPSEYFGNEARGVVLAMNLEQTSDEPIDFPMPKSGLMSVVEGEESGELNVTVYGFSPSSQVIVELHSDPMILGDFTANPSGVLQTTLLLPNELESGIHTLHAYGIDQYGQSVDAYQTLYVGASNDDFDGDEVVNSEDSCPTLTNTFVDGDDDGVDDVCDEEINILQEDTDFEKGIPSSETVAGTDDEIAGTTEGAVLGASTDISNAEGVLSETGEPAWMYIILGSVIAMSGGIMYATKRKRYFR